MYFQRGLRVQVITTILNTSMRLTVFALPPTISRMETMLLSVEYYCSTYM